MIEMDRYRESLEKAVLKVLEVHTGEWCRASDIAAEVSKEFPPLKPLNAIGRGMAVGRILRKLGLMRKRVAEGIVWWIPLEN